MRLDRLPESGLVFVIRCILCVVHGSNPKLLLDLQNSCFLYVWSVHSGQLYGKLLLDVALIERRQQEKINQAYLCGACDAIYRVQNMVSQYRQDRLPPNDVWGIWGIV